MSRYFTLCTDPLTADQEKALQGELASVIWWHWLPNYWLIKDQKDTATAASIRDAVKKVNHMARCMVLEVNPKTWAGLTKPDAQGRDMTQWITNHWITP